VYFSAYTATKEIFYLSQWMAPRMAVYLVAVGAVNKSPKKKLKLVVY